MEIFYSNLQGQTTKILHQVYRIEDFINRETQREDLIDANQFIQCSSLKLGKGVTFRPHRHVWKNVDSTAIAQESWVVIKGSVKCYFFDLDNTLIASPILNAGDVSFTFEGGHNYEILEDNTLVYEYKTGPYKGQQLDKKFI